MSSRVLVALILVPLALACGSNSSNCIANGQKATSADGGGCCSGVIYAGQCAPLGCWSPEQVSYTQSGEAFDPSGSLCCAQTGVTTVLAPNPVSPGTPVETPFCNPIPNCQAGGAVPTNGDAIYCCSAVTYSGVCTPAPAANSGEGPIACVLTDRVTDTFDGGDCCAGAGDFDAGFAYLCNPQPQCTASGSTPKYSDGSDCCSGEIGSGGLCCSLTGQSSNGAACCGGATTDSNSNCVAPSTCTVSGQPSVSSSGNDCCSNFASLTTGLCG